MPHVHVAIGDIHGCAREFDRLVEALDRDHPEAVIIPVGDLLTKGPDPVGVVRSIEALREQGRTVTPVCGNHDLRMLTALVRVLGGTDPDRLPRTEEATYRLLAAASCLRPSLRLLVETTERIQVRAEDEAWTVVHAGLLPEFGLDGTPEHVRIHVKARDGEPHWWETYDGSDGCIIVGHKPVLEPLVKRDVHGRPIVVNLDTGCVYGGHLSAWVIEEQRLVQVRSAGGGSQEREYFRDARTVAPARPSDAAPGERPTIDPLRLR